MSESNEFVIPAVAVSEAALAYFGSNSRLAYDRMKAALEAAAPIMLPKAKAEAWDEGSAEGRDCSGDAGGNPYRTTK